MRDGPISTRPRARFGFGLAILVLAFLPASLKGESDAASLCTLSGYALNVDVSSAAGTSDGNGVFEPNETVSIRPAWRYPFVGCGVTQLWELWGGTSALTGPPSGDYVVEDGRIDYLSSSADSYAMSVSAPAGRPASHWDASFSENVRGCLRVSFSRCENFTKTKAWKLHVGDSFADVPRSHPFYKKIETLLHNGITSGCAPTEFCPDHVVSRGQIAVFVARGLAGSAANIPASGTVSGAPYDCTSGGVSLFTDVDPADPFCKPIHFVASKGIQSGCAPGLYCSGDSLSRYEMAAVVANAFLQRPRTGPVLAPSASPLSDDEGGRGYSCDLASPKIHFIDVPETDPHCSDVHYLWVKGIISGCSPTEFCREGDVTRGAMAKFLVNAFGLKLYAP